MSDMKCPFCQRKLKTFAKYKDGTSTLYCSKCNLFGDSKLFSELIRTRKALEFITRISGAGMSYQDMFIDAHEVAKFALGQIKHPVLIGRYDKEMTDLLRGDDNG